MSDENHGSGPGLGLLDPPESKTETIPGKTAKQPAANKMAAAFFSKKTGRKIVEGAKWAGLGTLILGTGSFIYRKAKGMSWKGSLLSSFSFGPLDPQ